MCHLSHLNSFRLFSKNVSLHHIYNVLQPISAEKTNDIIFKNIEEVNFSDELFAQNCVTVLSVSRHLLQNKNFRMNERIFNRELSAVAQREKQKDIIDNYANQ